MRKRPMLSRALGVILMMLVLACNFPGLPENWPLGTSRETATPEPSRTGDEGNGSDPTEDTETTPPPLDTLTLPGAGSSPTLTPSATATPTLTPTPTLTATPEAVRPGPPLVFQDPAWEMVTWQKIPDTNDWQGALRIRVNGGTAPYRAQLENQTIVDGLEVSARWRICAVMPATIRVWSADGQGAQTSIWVPEVGCDN